MGEDQMLKRVFWIVLAGGIVLTMFSLAPEVRRKQDWVMCLGGLIASWLGDLKTFQGWLMAIGVTLLPVFSGLVIWVVSQPSYTYVNGIYLEEDPSLFWSLEMKRISVLAGFGVSALFFVSGFALSRLRRPEVPLALRGLGQ